MTGFSKIPRTKAEIDYLHEGAADRKQRVGPFKKDYNVEYATNPTLLFSGERCLLIVSQSCFSRLVRGGDV